MNPAWPSQQSSQIIKLAQYLAGLTAQQDVWTESGKVLINFFGADVCVFGARDPRGDVVTHHLTTADPAFAEIMSSVLAGPLPAALAQNAVGAAIRALVAETLESGFLAAQLFFVPEPLSSAFLPISHDNLNAVMLVGHRIAEPFPKKLLDIYLAVAGLIGATATRLAAEQELRQHRQHLAALVDERTAALTNSNQQLQLEITQRQRVEKALLIERDNLNRIFATMEDLIYIGNSDCEVVYTNPAFETEFSAPNDLKCYQYLSASEGICLGCNRHDILAGKTERSEWYCARNGKTYDAIKTPLQNADGSISMLVIFRDITARKQAEEALRTSESRFRNLYENASVGIFHASPAGKLLRANPAMARLLGYASPEELLTTITDMRTQLYADPEQRPQLVSAMLNLDAWFHFGAVNLVRKDGQIVIVDMSERRVLNTNGQSDYLEGFIEDITERVRAERALQESEQRLKDIIANNADGMLVLDQTGRVALVNPAAADMLHCTAAELTGTEFGYVVAPVPGEINMPYDNTRATLEMRAIDMMWNGVPAHLVTLRDVTERKRLEEQLQQQATTDELTGIANRRQFLKLAAQELKRAARLEHPPALVLIDLDHFKQINDTYGHAAGDQALVALTKLCQKHIREIDVFARFGGDEFALLLPETNRAQAYAAVERVRQILAAGPLDLAGRPVALTISVGLACATSAREPLDALLARADQALYRAKAAGRNRVELESTVA